MARSSSSSEAWSRMGRRRLLQAGLPAGAAAFAIACGGSKDSGSTTGGSGSGSASTPSTGGTVAAQAGAVDKIKPGHYTQNLAASQEEIDIAKTVKRGGTAKILYLDPPHFDFAKGYSCTLYDTGSLSYNKLLRAKMGANADPFKLELESDLAEKFEQTAADATEFTFTLKKNVKWQNIAPVSGRAFTAEDVKVAFERYAAAGVQKDFFSMVERFETPDPHTLKAKLKEPYVDFPATIATYSYITPRELWDNSDKINTTVIGTGPFIRDSWTPKQGSVFKRNPDYHEMGADGKPLPYLDRVETFVESNPAAAKAGYRSGNWHIYVPLTTDDGEDLLKNTPNTVWLDLPVSRGGNVNGFQFNMANPKFKDKRVRNAISMGIDRVAYDDLLYDGLNEGYSNTSMPWTFIFDKFPKLADQGPNYQRNAAEAKKLLEAAGAANLEFEIVEYYLTSGRDAFAPAQDMLREIGVKVRNKHVDNPTAITILANRNFDDAINQVWGPPNHSIDGWIYPWYITGGGLNYNGVSNPELDNLLKAQRREPDTNKRKEILRQIDKLLLDQNYDIWWPQAWYRQVWTPSLKNFRPHGFMGTSTCYSCEQFNRAWME
jgi:peptide/nickel transport system substrate-binding protein